MSVTLRPMDAAEFAAWTEPSISNYADDLARSHGAARDAALSVARAQFAHMLSDGLDTPHTWLFVIVDEAGVDAGTLWLGANPQFEDTGFVYDILIDEGRRGEGLGRAAMQLAEDVLDHAGYAKIQLSVFGFNDGARRLYESLGYDEVARTMTKSLHR
jgi:ribosomal protein S18 acetylase RimI-like enzyme